MSGGATGCRVRIRPARETDFPVLYRLVREEVLPYAQQSSPGLRVTPDELRLRLRRSAVLVAVRGASGRRRGGAVIGFVAVIAAPGDRVRADVGDVELKGGDAWIDLIAVARSMQAKGVGSRLIKTAESLAERRGAGRAWVIVDAVNRRAMAFYGRHGYADYGAWPTPSHRLMGKSLGGG